MYCQGYNSGYSCGSPCCGGFNTFPTGCCGGTGGYGGTGLGSGAAIILVLFILLVIVIGSKLVS